MTSANNSSSRPAPELAEAPDSTAVRVALWRAMHVQVDPAPHVFDDEVGLQLAAPDDGWRLRPDMGPAVTSGFRAAMVARARFIEDLVIEQTNEGVGQYVLLGAGLDTFAQRRPEIASRLRFFEVDRPGPQSWKSQRLIETGFGIAEWLRMVPVDFEVEAWCEKLVAAGFDMAQPAVVASTGVSMYLTKEANAVMLRTVASFAPGSTLAMTFLLPSQFVEEQDRPGLQMAEAGARASGTPFLSFFPPDEMLALAHQCGFARARHVPASALNQRYFADRPDHLRPSSGEDLLVAATGG